MPNSVSPDLVISPVHVKDAGFYICRVNCGESYEFSHWAQVDVLSANVSPGATTVIPMFRSGSWSVVSEQRAR